MKNQKKNNPFKVNQVRSIKCKAKAKAYTGQLKKLKDLVKTKVDATDDQLKSLEQVVRQAPQPSVAKQETSTNLEELEEIKERKNKIIEDYKKTESNTEEALSKLESWSCNT